MNGPGPMAEPMHGRRGRTSDQGVGPNSAAPLSAAPEMPAAPDLWTQSRSGPVPNSGANTSSLGLGGVPEPAFPAEYNQRGRDPVSRAMENNFPRSSGSRRGTASYDNPNAVGTVSAPLSPSRLYAQLEIGRGWGYDQRGSYGAPGGPAGPAHTPSPSTYGPASAGPDGPAARGRNVSSTRDLSMPSSQLHQSHSVDPTSPLPAFTPFSPPVLSASLHPSSAAGKKESGAPFISPSTLLSPQTQTNSLPAGKVDSLAQSFGQLGVDTKGEVNGDSAEH